MSGLLRAAAAPAASVSAFAFSAAGPFEIPENADGDINGASSHYDIYQYVLHIHNLQVFITSPHKKPADMQGEE